MENDESSTIVAQESKNLRQEVEGSSLTPAVDGNKVGPNPTPEIQNTVTLTQSSSDGALSPATPAKDKNLKFKVNVLLKPVGDAPILKQKLWSVDPDKPVSSIILFTKKCLRLESGQSLFLFVNQAFAPSPDQIIRNLYECFGSDGKLILHYSTTVAWG